MEAFFYGSGGWSGFAGVPFFFKHRPPSVRMNPGPERNVLMKPWMIDESKHGGV
jgi:hypothetical protein